MKSTIITAEDRYLKLLCLQNRHARLLHLKVKQENTFGVNGGFGRYQFRSGYQTVVCLPVAQRKSPYLFEKWKKIDLLGQINMLYGRKLN